ncbi:hypothetical protein SSX86_010258 [Deinandra increscens subsp. villosa]|uniref:TIR domain-containing protein n=1 Tax=Deinandra increscens subsp. villosa TaxID=3103831 RepID=A0AAP0DBR5_9ASTR
MASSSTSSHSAPRECKYDVFLSFRGEDTRKTFVDHFYSALVDRQIHTYKDNITLLKGESIGPSLFKAVEESRIAVIIFSKNYADSSWCLEELAYIMKDRDERGLVVMPVFYDVNPSEVRKQTGDFGKAFSKQEVENVDKVESWRKALVDASNIAGWEPKNIANGHESEVIKEITDRIMNRLFSLNSDVDENLVGMTTRLQDLKSLLNIGSGGVRMVGIWGIGGSGKSTLASSLYKEISHNFQCHCIVDNIRVESSKPAGLKALQENILSCVLKMQRQVQSVEEGKGLIKSRLCESNVLMVLDDVNDLDQLEALAGSHNWFGNGSRIVITTRDEHLLRTHKVDEVCHVKLLSEGEDIQLFNRRAFKQENTVEGYETLTLSAVTYAAGLPLALKVLGSFLYDKDKNEWKSALDKLKDTPDLKVMDILKTSYEGLETYQKELFLDIACFWRWKRIDGTMKVFEACKFYPQIGIKVLIQKALITIMDGYFDMHDLVQEMGHYIVRGEHPNNPEKHSRLWKDEEITNLCYGEGTTENDKIEVIKYYIDSPSQDHLSRFWKIVSNMKKLRWLSIYFKNHNYMNVEGPTFLSNELRHIEWNGYPASSLPKTFQPQKLVALVLKHSMQKQVWNDYKHLPLLKVLQLKDMNELLSTPDFDGLPCLQELSLFDCYTLKEIHSSLGNHTSLEYVKVHKCPKLKRFPAIFNMKNLKTLWIERCGKILEFPAIHANMENLVELTLRHIGIDVLPSSIGKHCTNLVYLNLTSLNNLKSIQFNFNDFKHLKRLELFGLIRLKKTRHHSFHQFVHSIRKLDLGHFKDVKIPFAIGELPKLEVLDLLGNDFSRLEFSLSQLTELKFLNLSYCGKLLELPKLPSNLAILKADYCNSLASIGDSCTNCKWLCQVSLFGRCIINDGGRLLQSMLEGKAIENGFILQFGRGNFDIPSGFTPPLTRGRGCTLQLQENWCNDFSGFLMCVVFKFAWPEPPTMICMSGWSSGIDSQDDMIWERSHGDGRIWVGYVPFGLLRESTWWDQTYKAISFTMEFDGQNPSCGFGVRLVAKTSRSETSTSSSSSDHYTPRFEIKRDLKSSLLISLDYSSIALTR